MSSPAHKVSRQVLESPALPAPPTDVTSVKSHRGGAETAPPLCFSLIDCKGLVFEFSLDKFAVQTRDVAQGDILGAFGSAGACIGAVSEAKLIHLLNHSACATCAFNLTLGQQSELANFRADKQHGRAVLASCHTCAATDTGSRVHSYVGNLFRDWEGVGVLSAAAVERNVAAGLLDFVERVTVNRQVTDYGERSRTPRLDGDSVAVVELTHMELAGGDTLHRPVGMTVDVE